MEVRKILVPYDSSEFSENALEYAVYLAKSLSKSNPNKKNIKIVILHVIQELPLTKAVLDKITSGCEEKKTPSLDSCIESIYQEISTLMEEDIEEKKTEI